MNEQVLAVQRMQDYIESHIEEEITMAGLSLASMFLPGIPTGCSGSIPG